MNTLIVIGYNGARQAYLNIPLDVAKRRFMDMNNDKRDISEFNYDLSSFQFSDEFCTYAAWPND